MNQILKNFVNQSRQSGYSDDAIKKSLHSKGWSKEDINPYFRKNIVSLIEQNSPSISLRIGLAFVFAYAAVNFTIHPDQGLIYIPNYVKAFIPGQLFLHLFTVYEAFLTLWLLSGKWPRLCGILTAFTVFSFTVLNLQLFSTLFRNVAITFAAIAYATLKYKKLDN